MPARIERSLIKFGIFEADPNSGELRKSGVKLKLQEQPFRVLITLLERPGEVVTREELQQRLWPADTFVDFDQGLNRSISQIREVLDDSAHGARFIETLPRRGYRFVAPVETIPKRPKRTRRHPLPGWFVPGTAVGLVALVLLGVVSYMQNPSPPDPKVVRVRQLTSDGFPKHALCSDGRRLFFVEHESGNSIAHVSFAGGDKVYVAAMKGEAPPAVYDVSEDGNKLLAGRGMGVTDQSVWEVPVYGAAARRIGDLQAKWACWTRGGDQVIFHRGDEFWLADANGVPLRMLAKKSGMEVAFEPSRDGRSVRFTHFERQNVPAPSVFDLSLADGKIEPLLPGEKQQYRCGRRMRGGEYAVFDGYSPLSQVGPGGLWIRAERKGARLVQLTNDSLKYSHPIPGPDGKTVYAIGRRPMGRLLRWLPGLTRPERLLPGLSAHRFSFPAGGGWMAYVSFPGLQLWRSRMDGSEALQLTPAGQEIQWPAYSPDGRQIAYPALDSDGMWKVYLIPHEGGVPRRLLVEKDHQFDPTWSPDSKRIAISHRPLLINKGVISVVDVASGQAYKIPGSERMFRPRWSPDGRLLLALLYEDEGFPFGKQFPWLYSFENRSWRKLSERELDAPCWSVDGRYIFGAFKEDIGRISTESGKSEVLFEMKDLTLASATGGVSPHPDGSFFILEDIGQQDIYALELELPSN